MLIVKNKKQQGILEKDWNYNPNRRFQYVHIYRNKKDYLENMGNQFVELGRFLLILITSPIDIVIQMYRVIQSLMWWCLVITRKNIDSSSLIIESTFRNPDDIEIEFDKNN